MSQKKILVYGGTGALGNALVQYFKLKNYWVGSIDIRENTDAHANVVVDANQDWQTQSNSVNEGVRNVLNNDKLDAIFNVAGGWAGGNSASNDFIKNSELMWKQSVWSSSIAANLAANFLNENGILTLTGAAPAVAGTPGMIGYGMAKAAVHQLTKSLADPTGGLPNNSFVACILPVTLDTPMNRKWMPNANFATWTPLEFIAGLFENWSNNQDRPANGSLVKLETENNETKTTVVV